MFLHLKFSYSRNKPGQTLCTQSFVNSGIIKRRAGIKPPQRVSRRLRNSDISDTQVLGVNILGFPSEAENTKCCKIPAFTSHLRKDTCSSSWPCHNKTASNYTEFMAAATVISQKFLNNFLTLSILPLRLQFHNYWQQMHVPAHSCSWSAQTHRQIAVNSTTAHNMKSVLAMCKDWQHGRVPAAVMFTYQKC